MLGALFNGLADMIYPKTCLVCKNGLKAKGSIDELICLPCRKSLKRNLPPFCHRCGRHLKPRNLHKNICPGCLRQPWHFDRAYSAFAYEDTMKELIHEFKYKGKDYLGKTLSGLMIEFLDDYDFPMDFFDALIPVPLYKSRLREREFNQARVLGDCIAERFNKPLIPDTLERLRNTRTQTELKDADRLNNVRDCFGVKDKFRIENRNILLIDDCFTTGATCSEAARALKRAGAGVVFVLTLAS